MTQQTQNRAAAIIELVAQNHSKSVEEVHNAMQEALDAAWEAAWAPGNIRAQVAWQRLFPGAQKPTLEEFIEVMATNVQNRQA